MFHKCNKTKCERVGTALFRIEDMVRSWQQHSMQSTRLYHSHRQTPGVSAANDAIRSLGLDNLQNMWHSGKTAVRSTYLIALCASCLLKTTMYLPTG